MDMYKYMWLVENKLLKQIKIKPYILLRGREYIKIFMKSLKTVKYYCLKYKEDIPDGGRFWEGGRGSISTIHLAWSQLGANFYVLNMKPEFEVDFPFISIPEIKYVDIKHIVCELIWQHLNSVGKMIPLKSQKHFVRHSFESNTKSHNDVNININRVNINQVSGFFSSQVRAVDVGASQK